jgi:maltooligosyltrehalose trehalohydrolase
MTEKHQAGLGCSLRGDGRCEFLVWAPRAGKVEIHLQGKTEQVIEMQALDRGYHYRRVEDVGAGSLYWFRIDSGRERPDPASRFQPHGVHGPSEIVDPRFEWSDGGWKGLPQQEYIFYEIHVGTFTPEGTLDAVRTRLDGLRELGITAIELMPVAQFPGSRNWGYDGVHPFAVQNSYGGPAALKRLVDACHQRGIAVVLDVVYNHLGPEGNYLAEFGPYFSDNYRTPWGEAVNFDGAFSDEVRRYFIENALYWVDDCHIDALRLDAIHAIVDPSARPFLEELGSAIHERGAELGRRLHVIPESDRNDSRAVRAISCGGLGLDALWNDDFHHALHAVLTGERSGYYEDFGSISQLAKALQRGFVYTGQYSRYRRRSHGNSAADLPAERFVVFAQNHDQVGNRMRGERLAHLTSFERLKLAAGAILLSPFLPLLFMGEEYGEEAPFLYFVSHTDRALIEAVREGRKAEFALFGWREDPPDPQSEDTFQRSILRWELRRGERHSTLYELYKALIHLRRQVPALASLNMQDLRATAHEREKVLTVFRSCQQGEAVVAYQFGDEQAQINVAAPPGLWIKKFDSAEERWSGPGSVAPQRLDIGGAEAFTVGPNSFVVYVREQSS